jgi:hypothetical protein
MKKKREKLEQWTRKYEWATYIVTLKWLLIWTNQNPRKRILSNHSELEWISHAWETYLYRDSQMASLLNQSKTTKKHISSNHSELERISYEWGTRDSQMASLFEPIKNNEKTHLIQSQWTRMDFVWVGNLLYRDSQMASLLNQSKTTKKRISSNHSELEWILYEWGTYYIVTLKWLPFWTNQKPRKNASHPITMLEYVTYMTTREAKYYSGFGGFSRHWYIDHHKRFTVNIPYHCRKDQEDQQLVLYICKYRLTRIASRACADISKFR